MTYIDDCMRCKNKMSQELAQSSNYCLQCLPLVNEKWNDAQKKIEKIRNEADAFSRGLDF